MSSELTPGPWEVVPVDYGVFHVMGISARGSHKVVVAAGALEADARLLAAAPDLWELVLQYRADLSHPLSDDSRQRRLEAIDRAIAKVSGT